MIKGERLKVGEKKVKNCSDGHSSKTYVQGCVVCLDIFAGFAIVMG